MKGDYPSPKNIKGANYLYRIWLAVLVFLIHTCTMICIR